MPWHGAPLPGARVWITYCELMLDVLLSLLYMMRKCTECIIYSSWWWFYQTSVYYMGLHPHHGIWHGTSHKLNPALITDSVLQISDHVHENADHKTTAANASERFYLYFNIQLPSVLWCCWLSSRKGIQSVKKLSGGVLAWLSVCSEVHMAQLTPLPFTVSCFSKSTLGFIPFWYWFTWVVRKTGR